MKQLWEMKHSLCLLENKKQFEMLKDVKSTCQCAQHNMIDHLTLFFVYDIFETAAINCTVH